MHLLVVVGLHRDNLRTHLRLNYIHVVKPEWGLSAQVRTRYFKVRVVSPPVRECAVPADFTST